MFSMETKNLLNKAIKEETRNAMSVYGNGYNSIFEGYAILKEEIEEATQENEYMKNRLDDLWQEIKLNNDIEENLYRLYDNSISCALESIQVCSVINKILGRCK